MKKSQNKKVALGMSGGVDSSVSAYLLKKEGFDVTGVYMQCWDSKADGCRADEDRSDALKVATSLGIPFKSLDFRNEYNQRVIDYFYKEYESGRTPNPDVMCNKEIKFGLFFKWALENNFDFVATGHYARNEEKDSKFNLLVGKDVNKDQSYFLYQLNQEILAKTLFPIGDFTKTQIREIAEELNLFTKSKPESMGICFIGEVNIKDFLMKRLPIKQGEVVDLNGEVIGEHEGIWFYTIGQRHGFKLSKYFGIPLYVVGKNVEKNQIIVGFIKDTSKSEFYATDLNFISDLPEEEKEYSFRIRHLGEFYKGKIEFITKEKLKISLSTDAFGVAEGQSAVIYDGDVVLGGGIISLS